MFEIDSDIDPDPDPEDLPQHRRSGVRTPGFSVREIRG
jgi:hypothetical protein